MPDAHQSKCVECGAVMHRAEAAKSLICAMCQARTGGGAWTRVRELYRRGSDGAAQKWIEDEDG